MNFKIRFTQKLVFIGLWSFPFFSVVFGVEQHDDRLLWSQSQSRLKDEIQSQYETSQNDNIEPKNNPYHIIKTQEPEEQIATYIPVIAQKKHIGLLAQHYRNRKNQERYLEAKLEKQAKLEADYKEASENGVVLEWLY